jgi:hypothetical protein
MSADTLDLEDVAPDGQGFDVPRLRGGVTDDGQRYSVTWYEHGVRRVALFRVATDDRVSVLQHVRSFRTSGRPEERVADVDPDVTCADLPDAALALMQLDGFEPADEVER